MILITLSSIVGCEPGQSALEPGPGPVDVVYTDPAGVEWPASGGRVQRYRATGPTCQPARWFQVGGLSPDALAFVVCIPDTGEAIVDPTIGVAQTTDAILFGGRATVLADEPTKLAIELNDGCLHPLGGTDQCDPQSGPATLVIEGPIDSYFLQTLEGEDGYAAVDSVTGDPICGGEDPD